MCSKHGAPIKTCYCYTEDWKKMMFPRSIEEEKYKWEVKNVYKIWNNMLAKKLEERICF